MDRPVKGESVSREGGEVSVERKEDSGSLWHRSHLHNSAGSRWTDWRINGQTERGETHTKKKHTRRHCCTASCSHSAAAKRKEEEEGMQKDKY